MQFSRLTGVLLTVCVCMVASAAQAQAQIAVAPCGDSNDFACGHLTVPLDPSGGTAGTITLALRRHRAPVGEAKDAIIALAGGPGQAAIPFAEQFAQLLGPIASTRDLIVFDQRGIGLSHPLSCHRFEVSANASPGRTIAECAAQIGPTRSFYATRDSVADIEAIRVAGGYEKLVVYGTSYGTKVAEEYAQAYPSHVEALVLDSVVPPNGPDPLDRATFAAVPRILGQLCAARACAQITPNPVGDLARLVRRLTRGALRGRVIDGRGVAHTVRITSDALLGILLDGDLEPTLRSEFPAAVRSAANGDTAALARLQARAESEEASEAESPSESFDNPLFLATSCEDEQFPWNRAAGPRERLAAAKARIAALGASAIAPFTRANVLDLSELEACAFWPFTTPAPAAADAPFPRVPTLILSGADDLRTPTADAREVAAQIPGSHLLVVPNTGHSVLGSDPTHCASDALQALFAGKPIKPCAATPPSPILHPTPLAPARLADVAPAKGNRGLAGRTLAAVVLTLDDFDRQLALRLVKQLEAGSAGLASLRTGGLRAGWAGLVNEAVTFDRYSYVPGVTVSGKITPQMTELRIGGSEAAHGSLRLSSKGSEKTLEGVLGGRHVRITRGNVEALSARASRGSILARSSALRVPRRGARGAR
ncbi:MAG TPA: alpha/beta fold hydrolase [Solirubrobacteraceae bacterium]